MEKKREDPVPEAPVALAEKEIDGICMALRESRNKPLLVMYYPDDRGFMSSDDIESIYGEFRRLGYNRDTKKVRELDILLHVTSGEYHVGYMVAQVLRSFASTVNFLVPYRALSAGTLTCLCANNISLGAFAYLSPVDVSPPNPKDIHASIDFFTDFAIQCRMKTDAALKEGGPQKSTSNIETELLSELIRNIGPQGVADFYRHRTIAAKYAYRLLSDYMFAADPQREERATQISQKLLFNYPARDFYMDYHICKTLGMKVNEMSEDDSDMTRRIVKTLEKYTQAEIVCKVVDKDRRAPAITLYGET
jgi:hypothetical protein